MSVILENLPYKQHRELSTHVFLNLLNELSKRDKKQGYAKHFNVFCETFNKFDNTRAQLLDTIYHMTLKLL